jgi:hypothetical protein
VFIILAVMMLMGLAGVIGALYWAKGKVEEAAHSSGAETLREGAANLRQDAAKLRDAVSSVADAQPTHAGCDILPKDQIVAILHAPIAHAEGNDAGDIKEFCDYWSTQADRAAERPAPAPAPKDGQAALKDLQDLAKSISSSANSHAPLLDVQVFRGTAKVALLSLKTASLLTGQHEQSIEGPWDEAYFGPFDELFFARKGNDGLMLKLDHVAQPRPKALALAQAMMPGV